MKNLLTSIITALLLHPFGFSQVYANNSINVSGWGIEIQDDGTCALGKLFEFGKRDSVIVIINSFGQVFVMSDKAFTGKIEIDGKNIINPVRSIFENHYMYSDSDNTNNGKVFITYFKLGNIASIQLKNGESRKLKLKGFTKAFNQYKKCAR
jgi:hypothetical protein